MCDDDCDCECECYCCNNEQNTMITTVSGTFCFILSLFIMVMFPLSVLVLKPLKMGLIFDANSMQVQSDKLWHPGRYWVGLSREFLEFPVYRRIVLFSDTIPLERTNKTGAQFDETSLVNPSIDARTLEGMRVNLSIMLAYKLGTSTDDDTKRDQVWDIYQKFGMDWDKFIKIVIQAETRNVMALYSVQQFAKDRLEIERMLFEQIRDQLKLYHFSIKTLYIMNLDFDASFRYAIKDTQVAIQQIQEAEYNKATVEVKANTDVTLSTIEKQIIIATATATAEATLLSKEAQALAIVKRLAAYKSTIKYAQTKALFIGTTVEINDAIMDMMYAYVIQYGDASQSIIQSLNLPVTLQASN